MRAVYFTAATVAWRNNLPNCSLIHSSSPYHSSCHVSDETFIIIFGSKTKIKKWVSAFFSFFKEYVQISLAGFCKCNFLSFIVILLMNCVHYFGFPCFLIFQVSKIFRIEKKTMRWYWKIFRLGNKFCNWFHYHLEPVGPQIFFYKPPFRN